MIDSRRINHERRRGSSANRHATGAGLKHRRGRQRSAVHGNRIKKNSGKFTAPETLRMNGATYSNFDNQEHVLKLGETFEKHPKSAFHTVRCKWRLQSVGILSGSYSGGRLTRVSLLATHVKAAARHLSRSTASPVCLSPPAAAVF